MNFNLNENLFRIKGACLRRFYRFFGQRPVSSPYLSGDTLRAEADMVFDEQTNSIRPEQVKPETVIFVGSPLTEEFFRNTLPKITSPFTLITHNGDTIIDDRLANLGLSSGKITRWYAMAVATRHPLIVPVPAGLENLRFYFNGIPRLFDHFCQLPPRSQKSRILYGFSISTNPPERQPAFDFLSRCPLADPLPGWPQAPRYLDILSGYKFVAAPPGNGLDSHRAWEALYLGVIPIVKRSPMTESFRALGLPIWIIDKWDELEGITETELTNRYEAMQREAKNEALWADYWKKRVRESNHINKQ